MWPQLTRVVTQQEGLRNKVCGWWILRPKPADPVHAHLSPALSPSSRKRGLGREPEEGLRVNSFNSMGHRDPGSFEESRIRDEGED